MECADLFSIFHRGVYKFDIYQNKSRIKHLPKWQWKGNNLLLGTKVIITRFWRLFHMLPWQMDILSLFVHNVCKANVVFTTEYYSAEFLYTCITYFKSSIFSWWCKCHHISSDYGKSCTSNLCTGYWIKFFPDYDM